MILLALPLGDKAWLFSAQPDLSKPRDPSAVTRRYRHLAAKLGINTQLKQLRHYSATELTAGVDLQTVAGRLGHSDGFTTLRHYAAGLALQIKQPPRPSAPVCHRRRGRTRQAEQHGR